MNRYIERADNYARFISVNFNLALDLPPNVPEQWEPLIVATADHNVATKNQHLPIVDVLSRNQIEMLTKNCAKNNINKK
jgi:uncharacterized alpha-E superfamily protein